MYLSVKGQFYLVHFHFNIAWQMEEKTISVNRSPLGIQLEKQTETN
jgi:hypothetical protein